MKQISLIGLFFYVIQLLGQNAGMQPRLINQNQLPFALEGYTVNIEPNGQTKLYNTYSNEPAKNILNQGGIRIEIATLQRTSNFSLGGSNKPQEAVDDFRTLAAGLKKESIYKLHLKISLGNSFDDRRRHPTNLQGPISQLVIHLPSSVKVIDKPIIKIDGTTQAEQMVHNLLSIGSLGISSGASHLSVGLKNMIIKAIDKAASDFVVHSAFRTYKPSENIEVYDRVNFGNSRNLQQITWVLGGHRMRDISTAKNAELTLYLEFEEEGKNDISMFFNIWGTHTYTPRNLMTTTLYDIILHSFRQHVVLGLDVVK